MPAQAGIQNFVGATLAVARIDYYGSVFRPIAGE
jgi:hypothetical protein